MTEIHPVHDTGKASVMKKVILTSLASIGAVAMLSGCSSMNHQTHTNCLVTGKDRILTQGSSGEKRVITSCGVFAVSDSVSGGFNSYDTYAALVVGHRYDIQTGGYRVGFLSQFPNIVGVTPR